MGEQGCGYDVAKAGETARESSGERDEGREDGVLGDGAAEETETAAAKKAPGWDGVWIGVSALGAPAMGIEGLSSWSQFCT